MAELEWASDGRFVDRDRDIEVANDPDEDENTTYDVPDDAVDEYLERPGWTRPDEDDGDQSDDGESNEDEDEDADDIDQLLEGTVDEVSDELESGTFDDRLDEVADRADRQGVQEAIDDRRDTLENEG